MIMQCSSNCGDHSRTGAIELSQIIRGFPTVTELQVQYNTQGLIILMAAYYSHLLQYRATFQAL
jgi:hypothetical protein